MGASIAQMLDQSPRFCSAHDSGDIGFEVFWERNGWFWRPISG
jgi:hypothetical protein